MFITKFITYIKVIITEFITNIHFIMQSTTPFIAIAFVLLLAAIIYVAIKCPAKLHSIGTVTIVFGLFCFSVAFVSVYDCLQRDYPDCSYHQDALGRNHYQRGFLFSGKHLEIPGFTLGRCNCHIILEHN